jgi:DNA-binding NarL/FixJ family response regulator
MAKYRVLLVDDQREIRFALMDAISTLGPDFSVVGVPSGEEAILDLSSKTYDLLITDVRLPGISGLELIRKTKQLNPEMNIILMTGLMEPHIRQEVADAGAAAFFLKPIEMADFLDAVERCVGLVDASPIAQEILSMAKPVESVSERLTSLRIDINAIAAVLLDERGRALAQAGDLPDASVKTALFPALMSAFSASNKVTKFLQKEPPNDLMYFSGLKYDIFLAHVGESYALLVAANPTESSKEVRASIELIHTGLQDLLSILEKMGIPVKSDGQPAQVQVEIQEEDLEESPELEAIFQEKSAADIDQEEVDAFWDTASHRQADLELINADALTYEQARRLGLTPEDEDEQE